MIWTSKHDLILFGFNHFALPSIHFHKADLKMKLAGKLIKFQSIYGYYLYSTFSISISVQSIFE